MKKLLSAAEAASLLGVSAATLYSYVSRGMLSSLPGTSERSKLYPRDQVLRLAARRKDGRQAGHTVEQAIDWGKPILESRITLIEHGVIRYRGHDAMKLAHSATLEQVAAILWDSSEDCFNGAAPAIDPQRWSAMRQPFAGCPPLQRAAALLAAAAPTLPQSEALADGAQLMRVLAAALLDADISTAPLHQQCREAWRLGAERADLLRAALIACADHELNVSTFTVRCVASTGAPLPAALLAGLSALSGPRHGGESLRVWAMIDAAMASADMPGLLRRHLSEPGLVLGYGSRLPGFGHPLYPEGDPRGRMLIEMLKAQAGNTGVAALLAIAEAASELTGHAPNIDFALAAIEHAFGLVRGASQTLFALGRCAGWIAHANEQAASGQLIRPRARYVGSFDFLDY
ncbi:citrate synthase family protein [Collimonas sp.]|jgi:citrate synthase|uniref:citrate synthase family protein n=1 Tax=Collimonas sp. TaxID=1963772 RepID=UPI002BC2DBF9|nr:citrate synthase family protein [Collimonas sp.]HWW99564.1 citrate synthase family protein [Collimonas sp.]